MIEVISTLKKLKFDFIPQDGCDAFSKKYKGFILFIVIAPTGKILSSITVRNLEISLPNIPDAEWVANFDKENQN